MATLFASNLNLLSVLILGLGLDFMLGLIVVLRRFLLGNVATDIWPLLTVQCYSRRQHGCLWSYCWY